MPASSKGKTDGQRSPVIGVVAAVIIVLAVVVIYKMWAANQVHAVKVIDNPVGSSEKMQAMKAMHDNGESVSDNIDVSKARRN